MVDRRLLGETIGYRNSAHEIAVVLTKRQFIRRALPRIGTNVKQYPNAEAFHWEKAMPGMANAIKMDHVGLQIIVAFMYIIVGIGTINTLLMSVMERKREFGVIRAIGLSKTNIRKIVFSEAFVLAVTGVAAGMTLAIAAGLYTYKKGIDYSSWLKDQGVAGTLIDPVMYSGWDWVSMFVLGGVMILLALAASLYPAHYILKIQPSEAMRSY